MTGELTGLMRKDTDTPIQVKLEAKAAWDLWKVQAYSEIMLHVEDEPQVSIMGSQNPKEAWVKLERTYSS
jgi:hypothetical protein